MMTNATTKPATWIKFTADKLGRPMAHRYCRSGHRWLRMGLDEANFWIATGRGRLDAKASDAALVVEAEPVTK